MSKFFCTLACALSFLLLNAQTQNSQDDMQSLVQKVNSLEHELTFFKTLYNLNKINNDITMFANDVYTTSIAIQLDILNKNFNYQLANTYKENYESCLYKMQSYSKLIEVQKESTKFNIMTFPYSESEQELLMSNYNLIDYGFNALENVMKLFKSALDAYKLHLF